MPIEKSEQMSNYYNYKTNEEWKGEFLPNNPTEKIPQFVSELFKKEDLFSKDTSCSVFVDGGNFWLADEPTPDDHYYGYISVWKGERKIAPPEEDIRNNFLGMSVIIMFDQVDHGGKQMGGRLLGRDLLVSMSKRSIESIKSNCL